MSDHDRTGSLHLGIGPYESVVMTLPDGRQIIVSVPAKHPRCQKIRVVAPRDIPIHRIEHAHCDHEKPL